MSNLNQDQVFNAAAVSGANIASPSTPSAGNIAVNSLILAVVVWNGSATLNTVTDNRGQVWVRLRSVASPDGTKQIQVWATVATGTWSSATPLIVTAGFSASVSGDVGLVWISGSASGGTPAARQKIDNVALEAATSGSPAPPQVGGDNGDLVIAVGISAAINNGAFGRDFAWSGGGGGAGTNWQTGTAAVSWAAMLQWFSSTGGSTPGAWLPSTGVSAQHASLVFSIGDPRKAIVA
jgi:hypothetical protein